MMNYHELTMNEPRDSPQRRKQFLVICAIMATMTVHAALSAGILATITMENGTFPGGEFVYKLMTKDYAASTGTLRRVASDLKIIDEGSSNFVLDDDVDKVHLDTADLLYSIFLDEERVIPGGKTRFASGVLLFSNNKSSRGDDGAKMKKMLLEVNKDIKEVPLDGGFGSESLNSKDVKYEVGRLPKVDAVVAQHPFTAGAWSAILQSYKIIPKFRRYAQDHQESMQGGKIPIIIATCSSKQQMCTYYMVSLTPFK